MTAPEDDGNAGIYEEGMEVKVCKFCKKTNQRPHQQIPFLSSSFSKPNAYFLKTLTHTKCIQHIRCESIIKSGDTISLPNTKQQTKHTLMLPDSSRSKRNSTTRRRSGLWRSVRPLDPSFDAVRYIRIRLLAGLLEEMNLRSSPKDSSLCSSKK